MPPKHKEKNTIRFQRFADRIANVNVDVIHRIGHRNEELNEEEVQSYFYCALEKWNDLNCSQGWQEFFSEVKDVQTLAQLILLRERVINSLLDHLGKKDQLSIQALLEVVVAVVRDLRQDFYPFYPQVLSRIVQLLNCKDPEVLEWSFQCLAYLFKFLWRCMVRTVKPVLSSLLPLLSSKQPKYINYFAADSFAFLARKVRDQGGFLSLILDHLKDQPEDAEGCGRLVFAWIRGIKGQLHSCAESVLLKMMQAFGSKSTPILVLENLMTHTVTHLVNEIQPGSLTCLWEAIRVSLCGLYADFCSGKQKSLEAILVVLRLVNQICSHCEAVHLTKPTLLVELLLPMLSSPSPLPGEILVELSSITAILLMSSLVSLPQDRTAQLTSKILNISPPHVVLLFVKKLLSWSALETLVLPRLLEIVVAGVQSGDIGIGLEILAELVQFKVPSLYKECNVQNLQLYKIDFSSASVSVRCDANIISSLLLDNLDVAKLKKNVDISVALKDIVCALQVLPHLKPLNKEESCGILGKLSTYVCEEIRGLLLIFKSSNDENSDQKEVMEKKMMELLLLLSTSVEAAVRLQAVEGQPSGLPKISLLLDTLLPLSSNGPWRLCALRILNLYLSSIDFNSLKDRKSISLSIYEHIKLNLAASHHLVRVLTCQILSQLPLGSTLQSMFRLCLEAENTEATISDYRTKIQLLQKLSFQSSQPHLVSHFEFRMAPLYFIFGSLYINFQLLWEPIQSLISSYALGMQGDEFWPVFQTHLSTAIKQRDYLPDYGTAPEPAFDCSLLDECYLTLNHIEDKPDYAHYRLLLWQATHSFPEVCEVHNRHVVPLFLTFMEVEYFASNAEVASSWNIKKHDDHDMPVDVDSHSVDSESEEGGVTNQEDDQIETNESMDIVDNTVGKVEKRQKNKRVQCEGKPSSRLLTRTLLAQLGLLSKIRNPRTMFREEELSEVYEGLLSHKNPDLQKAALECILAYKHKYLTPYSQHLFALIDNKSFKNEVTQFKIDKDSGIIQEEHRPQLIPIIMRIVYSKMTAKTGMRTGGKGGSAMRRALVLRFLAGCHEDEMLVFVKRAFSFFLPFLQDDLLAMVDSIQSSIDLERVIPPRRLQSVINLLSVVQEQFGGLMGTRLLSLILQLLTCVGATVDGILKKRDDIHVGFIRSLRGLRTLCIEALTHFFDRFEAYPWSTCEIDTVLRVFVFPLVDRLLTEEIYGPSALMKLFTVWSQHPRYFILFGSHAPNSKECNPLSAIMKLLLGAKTDQEVCNSIMEILENLISLKDHKQLDENDMEVDETHLEERAPPIHPTHLISLHEKEIQTLSLPQRPNLGSKLLFPHISSILERFRTRLASHTKRGHGLNKRELLVLSGISEFVRAPDTSATLAQLLLPILTKRLAAPHEDEEIVLKMMNTLCYLIRNVKDPQLYLRPLASLFSCINGVAGRKMLVSLINTVAESSAATCGNLKEEIDQLAKIVRSLNAYDKRWVEQPDFDQRLDAFKTVQGLLDEGKLSVDLGVIVIHHCFYVIRSEKDMGLRDFASHCLRRVAPALSSQQSNDESTTKFIVDTTLLTLIRNAIRKGSGENVYSEAVLLLGEMAKECSHLHPVLRDLNLLTNKLDVEVDFFENLTHLQLYRKCRALLKFSEVFEGVEKAPSPRTLTQFILPLVSQFVCSEQYMSKNSLIDAAVKAFGVVCRLLPWHQYEAVLRFYLDRLKVNTQFQKQLVRIVMNILDAFHFDLSKAQINFDQSIKNGSIQELIRLKKSNVDELSESANLPEKTNPLNKSEMKGEVASEEELEELNEDDDEDKDSMEVDESEPEKIVLAVERQTVLCPSAADRVIRTIRSNLLPQLHRALTARTLIESIHKVNKKQVRNSYHDRDLEEEEVLRVPMAFAVVKLLQRLPKEMLLKNLPGVFVKLCTFLKSRLESVRRVTRETLQKVMLSLGPSMLRTLLQEMTTLLTRGFQVHVLVFSIHSVLIALKDIFKEGDIDDSLPYIIEVCKIDLFGSAAEEKEEGKIASKLTEAQSNKSYNTLLLTSQFVSEHFLTNLLVPFKELIQTARSHKIVNRASECLRHIVLGLTENTFIPSSSLLIFAVGVASESIPALSLKQNKKEMTPKQKEFEARRGPDCLIIKEVPKQRSGITVTDAARLAARMNAHVFVEFGLRLIYFLLKHEKLKDSGEDVRPLVDPLIPLFNNCLSSQHVKLSTLSMQCLSWLLRMDLPSLREHVSAITASIFALLHKFAAAGLSKGDNFDLVMAAFKAVAVIVRDVKYYSMDEDQLKALLLYAEQDLADAQKHATAFALLKAILSRKFVLPEIHDVMNKIATMSITSDLPHVRLQARVVFHQFLMEYPLGKKLEKHLSFYLSQLSYELQPGRESALEMVNSIICSFPLHVLAEHSGLFFLMLGARLVNDDSPDCRKMVAQCISKMILRLSNNERERLFNISFLWLRDKNVSHRRLAAQLCGIFVTCEKAAFKRHLPELLPVIIAQFASSEDDEPIEPGKFVKISPTDGEMTSKNLGSEKMKDHHLYQVLQLVLKICVHCPDWLSEQVYKNHVFNLTEHCQSLLAHPHEWVRLSAAQVLTHVLSSFDVAALSSAISGGSVAKSDNEKALYLGFFEEDASQRLKSMILDHCAQLAPNAEVAQELLLQVVKNLVICADILKDISDEEISSGPDEMNNVGGSDKKSKPLSLLWLVKRMRRVVNLEIVHAPKSTIMRTMVFNWTAAVAVKLGGDRLRPVLHHLIAPLVREMASDEPAPEGSAIEQLRSLAKEVGSLVKKTVGHGYFLQIQSRVQNQLVSTRAERSRKRKQEAVADPERAAKRKIKKQIRKKESKKLRQIKMSGKKFKRKREVALDEF